MISTFPTARAAQAASNETDPHSLSRGFTLLETLITVALIATGITALLLAFNRGIFASGDAASLRTATALAQAKLEELKDTPFASIVSESRAALSGFAGFERAQTVTSAPGGTDSNLKQVAVTVYWTLTGGEATTTLTTYFYNL